MAAIFERALSVSGETDPEAVIYANAIEDFPIEHANTRMF